MFYFRSILIYTIVALLLSSCGDTKIESPLAGTWIENTKSSNDSTAQKFIFSRSDSDQKFFAYNWMADTLEGTWTLQNDSLLIHYIFPESIVVDSIVLENEANGKTTTNFYHKNQLATRFENGAMEPVIVDQLIKLDLLNNNEMAFHFDGRSYVFYRVVVQEKPISFMSIFRGIIGIMSLLVITFLFSGSKKRIDWSLVLKGTLMQIIIAILVLKVPFVEGGFNWLSHKFVGLIGYTDDGVDFLFGQLGIGVVQAPLVTFAVKVLPTIIFFSALMSALYYMGVLQKVVYAFAWLMKKFMRLSGAESLAAAGNVFLGQTESPLLVKPYLLGMTKSEMMCLMTGGMATIAGGVLAAYVSFLGGDDPVQQAFFAKHLLTASIISAPAAIVASKILVPETEEINQNLAIDKQKIGTNILEAISNGTSDGLRLAVNVGAMLLVFIALMALGNGLLGWIGEQSSLNAVIAENTPYKDGLSFQFILGYIGAPIVWLIGVDGTDIVAVGELLGQKTVLNEFIAYPNLGVMKDAGVLSDKSVILSTYMLCGFANFASIGIQIGGIGSLVPSRKGLLSSLGMKALLGGTIASLMTAAIVGMLY